VYTVSGSTITPASPSTISTGSFPQGVAFSPDGSLLVIANAGSNNASVYTVSGSTITPASPSIISTGNGPEGVAFSPDGSLLVITNFGDNNASVYTVSGSTITPQSILVTGVAPFGVAFSSDGSLLVITNQISSNASVYTVLGSTITPSSTLSTGSNPLGVAFSPDGTLLVITNSGSTGANGAAYYTVCSSVVTPTISPASGSAIAGPTVLSGTMAGGNTVAVTSLNTSVATVGTVSLAATTWQATLTPVGSGSVTINVQATDCAGSSSAVVPAVYTVCSSVVTPTISPASGTSFVAGTTTTIQGTVSNGGAISFTSSNPSVASVGTASVSGTHWSATLAAKDPGSVVITVTATDCDSSSLGTSTVYNVITAKKIDGFSSDLFRAIHKKYFFKQ